VAPAIANALHERLRRGEAAAAALAAALVGRDSGFVCFGAG
jgi:hypothetical protein